MRYSFNGSDVRGSSPDDLVAKLHKQSESPAETDAHWMREVSSRVEVMFGKQLDVSSAEAFIQGLVSVGILKEVGED
jgi:hypothetical protein